MLTHEPAASLPGAHHTGLGYLIVAHRLPDQVLRLVTTLRRSSSGPIAVHIDRSARRSFAVVAATLAAMPDVLVFSARRVAWGHYSIVEAIFDTARELLRQYPALSHVKHLSGQDYPLQPLAQFEVLVAAHAGQSLMDSHDVTGPGRESQAEHVRYRYFTRLRRNWLRWPLPRRLPPMRFHGGSAFWCLARAHLAYVLALPSQDLHFFRGTLAADELVFQTLLANSPHRAAIVPMDVTWTSWPAGAASPATLDQRHFSVMIASGAFFARKFDPDHDAAVLDRIDHRLAQRTTANLSQTAPR